MMKKIVLALAVILPVCSLCAADYYVSQKGSPDASGSLRDPFDSLQKAADMMEAGDTCHIRGGNYHEHLVVNGLRGREGAACTFRAYDGEEVTFDGSLGLAELGSTGWTLYKPHIYKTQLNTNIWQLYLDGKLMVPARWPNANFEDGSIWDQKNWGYGSRKNIADGQWTDRPHEDIDLAASGLDMTGAMAILNSGSWKTWTRRVTNHLAGSSTFFYAKTPRHMARDQHYFMECKLNLLDTEGEWFFDPATKELYLWAPGGGVPRGDIRAKVQDYALEFKNSAYIKLVGLNFFGTTFRFQTAPHTTVEDCNLLYPSCSKRMLGVMGNLQVTSIIQPNKRVESYSSLINSSFRYAGSEAVRMSGRGDRIENCLFEYIDWSASDAVGLMGSIVIRGNDNIFRRNTVRTSGASQVLMIFGKRFLAELNDCSDFGLLQDDGGAFHYIIPTQPGSITRYNWVYNAPQHAIRFDAPIPPVKWGSNGLVEHNVGWNCSDVLMLKGKDHFCYNNTALNSLKYQDIIILDKPGFEGTITRNNAAGMISGSRRAFSPIPGTSDHNWNGYERAGSLADQLRDPAIHDFRPVADSELIDAGVVVDGVSDRYRGAAPDIGAYEFGSASYWIPGRKSPAASRPIPPDGATGQSPDRDLIWLGGYRGQSYKIYFGSDAHALATADESSKEFQGIQTNNIFVPSHADRKNTNWYWRVDTLTPSKTIKGVVWNYSTTPAR